MNPLRCLQACFARFGSTPPVNEFGELPGETSPTAIAADAYVAPPEAAPAQIDDQARRRLIWGPLADLARLAPTPHNTQPFRIQPLSDTEAAVLLLPERLLPEEDHGNRYMMMSTGIFARAMEIAGRARGLALEITPNVEVDPERLTEDAAPVVVATVRITGQTAQETESARLLQNRKTSRLKYHRRPVSPAVLASLSDLARCADHRFSHYNDPRIVDHLLRQNAQSVVDNLQLTNETAELERWLRFGKTPTTGDGMWEEPLNQKKWMTKLAFRFPWFFKLPIVSHISKWIYRRTMAGTCHVGLLCGQFENSAADLFATGRFFLDFWLEMQRHGVVMQPMGSMLTNASHSARVHEYFGVTDCWLAFRFGYSDDPPRAPRLASVLVKGGGTT